MANANLRAGERVGNEIRSDIAFYSCIIITNVFTAVESYGLAVTWLLMAIAFKLIDRYRHSAAGE